MKILVTGSGTLLGNNVVFEALKKKYDIIASYRKSFPRNLRKKKISIIKLDLEKNFNLNFKVDCLIHCASAIPSDNLNDKKMMKINYIGFKKLASQLIKKGCKKIILVSSMSVYGNVEVNTIDLQTKIKPVDSYGYSKFKSEKYLQKLNKKKKINFFILRLPALVGKNSDYNFISKLLKKIKNDEKISYTNPNLKFNNFIHVKNLAKILIDLTKLDGSKIFNIASLRPVKLKNIIEKIYNFEKKENNSIIKDSSNKGFNIKVENYLKKNFTILSTNQTLNMFLKDNQSN